ncbi:MAG TPA: hypothetical protein VI583_08725 [Cyclobacteriaceae bacterium]|nr:hypothetical protein [Cyclobacteriaceae bacterium]
MLCSSIWEGYSLKKRIVYLINYSSVFNDVMNLDELKNIIDPHRRSRPELDSAIAMLLDEKKIIIDNGYAGIPVTGGKMEAKHKDIALSLQVVNRLNEILLFLARLPIIKFIGISGSIAANNPVDSSRSELDLDIFIITSRRGFWVFCFLEALYRNLGIRRMMKYPFCFNYIMAESDLIVHNQCFYTATEIKNIKPVYGMPVFLMFLKQNEWVFRYYPHLASAFNSLPHGFSNPSRNRTLPDKILFVAYTLIRCIKKFSFRPLQELSFEFRPRNVLNLTRKIQSFGGYEFYIGRKFEINLRKYFPEYYDPGLIEALFPDNSGPYGLRAKAAESGSAGPVIQNDASFDRLIAKYGQ